MKICRRSSITLSHTPILSHLIQTCLINISTGKSVTDATSTSLLNIPEDGKKRHESFVKECLESAERFEKPTGKHPLRTFANECVTNRKADKNAKEAQIKCTSALLGRIAFTAAANDTDLEYVLSFPLTPVPLSMGHSDGTMTHTDKSKLFKLLEGTVSDRSSPSFVSIHIIDGNFQFHCISPDQPAMYGELSRNILVTSLSYKSRRININFDTYERPSIKDCEREQRSCCGRGTSYQRTSTEERLKLQETTRESRSNESYPSFSQRIGRATSTNYFLMGRKCI